MTIGTTALLLAAWAGAADAQWRDGYTADRSASASTRGARVIRIDARAGTLRVDGRSGSDEVRARGKARASSRRLLVDVRLVAERRGDVVEVRAEMPEHDDDWNGEQWTALDLEIEVPADARLEVEDTSGDAELRGVGELSIVDGSGELRVEGVAGALDVRDGSGEVSITDARGDVHIRDGSGDLVLRRVRGTVDVESDGSGGIDVADVGGLRVESKGSGSVHADGVEGDLIVDHMRSSDIRYSGVRGAVRIPERVRRDRRYRSGDDDDRDRVRDDRDRIRDDRDRIRDERDRTRDRDRARDDASRDDAWRDGARWTDDSAWSRDWRDDLREQMRALGREMRDVGRDVGRQMRSRRDEGR
jgi:hypothetical protein